MRHRTVEVTADAAPSVPVADITDELRRAVRDAGVTEGCVIAFCAHTTCTLVINEMEEGALEDLWRRLRVLVPADDYYAHDDLERRRQNLEDGHERANGGAHVAQMILGGSSHVVPVSGGEPVLGRWQRLLLLELDEPRPRTITFQVLGS